MLATVSEIGLLYGVGESKIRTLIKKGVLPELSSNRLDTESPEFQAVFGKGPTPVEGKVVGEETVKGSAAVPALRAKASTEIDRDFLISAAKGRTIREYQCKATMRYVDGKLQPVIEAGDEAKLIVRELPPSPQLLIYLDRTRATGGQKINLDDLRRSIASDLAQEDGLGRVY